MSQDPTEPQLPEGGYLFLSEIGEPSNNDLRVVVVLGAASDSAVEAELGSAFPVVTDDRSWAFELTWWNYVAYSVLNESYALRDDKPTIGTRRFGRKPKSAFLAHVAASTWATDEHPGKLTHWYLNAEWHCLDVVSVGPPDLRELQIDEAQAEAAKLSAGGGTLYEARSGTSTRK